MASAAGSSRRRILFLTPQVPYPPEQGTALRNYNLIRQVAQRHDADVLSFADDGWSTDSASPLRSVIGQLVTVPVPRRGHSARLRTLLTSRTPDMAVRLRSEAYAQALHDMLSARRYDILQVEGIELAAYGLGAQQTLGDRCPPVVYDDHNAEYVLQQRAFETDVARPMRWPHALYSLIQWQRLRRYERHVCRSASAVLTCSTADAHAVERLDSALQPLVVPNGVDVERYHPELANSLPLQHPAVVFTGKMDFRPNIDGVLWFYEHVWPTVTERVPEVQLYIVGKAPSARLAPLAQDSRVHVTGYVPDILPYFGGADAYIVPLRIGGGTRLKVLEAMAAGLPVVGTTLGVEGIEVTPGEHLLVGDSPEAFAEHLVNVVGDSDLGNRLGRAARQRVMQRYDWATIAPLLEPVYSRL